MGATEVREKSHGFLLCMHLFRPRNAPQEASGVGPAAWVAGWTPRLPPVALGGVPEVEEAGGAHRRDAVARQVPGTAALWGGAHGRGDRLFRLCQQSVKDTVSRSFNSEGTYNPPPPPPAEKRGTVSPHDAPLRNSGCGENLEREDEDGDEDGDVGIRHWRAPKPTAPSLGQTGAVAHPLRTNNIDPSGLTKNTYVVNSHPLTTVPRSP